MQHGTATCETSGPGSVAIVHGDGSTATATDGDHNLAMVRGDGSTATAGNGDGNTATVTGDDSWAYAVYGENNTATAAGDGEAYAVLGDNNTVEACDGVRIRIDGVSDTEASVGCWGRRVTPGSDLPPGVARVLGPRCQGLRSPP